MGGPWNVLEVCERDGVGSSEERVTSEDYIMRLRSREAFVGCGGVVYGRLEYSLWSISRKTWLDVEGAVAETWCSRSRGCRIPTFLGVYPSDLLTTTLSVSRSATLIVNTDPHNAKGKHWLPIHL